MIVVTFTAERPPARFDNKPWTQARIEESATQTGPFTAIATITLSPTDTDPTSPADRDFTTENATLDQGWYRIVWVDADGDESIGAATPRPVLADLLVSVAQVANHLRARTKGGPNGQSELGTFDTTTRPTATDVQAKIRAAAGHVATRLGPRIPETALSDARDAVALRAAYRIERSYWPEQLEADNSTFRSLKDEYGELMADLQDTLEDADLATTSRISSQPVLSPTLSSYPEDLRPGGPWLP